MESQSKRRYKVAVEELDTERDRIGSTAFNFPADGFLLEREALDPIGAEIVEIPAKTDEEFIAGAGDADAVIARLRRMSAGIIRGLRRCRIIAFDTVGTDLADVEAATEAGIVVSNVPDVFIEEVADHTMALFLASYRRLKEMEKLIRDGRFIEGHTSFWETPRLWGQTFGLISFGNIARAVARRLQPFGLHVIAYDPYVSELECTAERVEPVGFMELLERSDFVSNHLPSSDSTRHMIAMQHFEAMKQTAIFINAGRGDSVDERALVEALEIKEIAGAALDVFEHEPVDPDHPLLAMSNVVCTPHIASATKRMITESRRRLGREIALVLQGYWPRSAVNPVVLSRTDLKRWQPYPMHRGPNR